MTFYDYIVSLKISPRESQVGIALDLLNYAGAKKLPSEETIKSWLNRSKKIGTIRVPCESQRYFPKLEMDGKKFMDFIKRRIHTDVWKKVQEAFASVVEDGDAVDVHTDDREVFCESLMRRFYLLFGLHLSENYEFKVSTSESNAVAETEPVPEPIRQDDDLNPEQIEIAPPQDEEEQDSLSIDAEKDDCAAPELLPSDIEQEAEHELAEVHEEEKELKVPAVTSPYSLCENFMRIVKTHAYSIDLFLNRSTEDVGRTEFEEIIPAAQDFIELQTELKSMDENTGCPKAVKEFIRRFCKYYAFFKDSYLDYLCHTDETFAVLDNLNLDIFLEQANGLRKAAGKRYSAAKSTALAVISKHDAENEQT